MKLVYAPDRFAMPKMYHTQKMDILTSPEKLVEWVKGAINGEEKLYWESEKIP